MYPTSPTVTEWRRSGAANYRAKGGIVPAWYDGTDAASARLANEEPSAFAAVRYEMNAYAIANPDKFTPEHRAIMAKQNGLFTSADAAAQNYTPETYGVGAMAGDFAKAYTEQLGQAVIAGDYSLDPVKHGPRPVVNESAGLSWGAVIGLGVATGIGIYAFNKGAA